MLTTSNSRGVPVFSIHRTIFPSSQLIVEISSSGATVAMYAANSGDRLELGTVIHARDVGPFVIRLAHEAREDVWNLVEVLTPQEDEDAVVLTYSSREIATRYVEEATEIDLTSDFDPTSHFFGERRAALHS
jgi:hypothetical protein